MKIERGNERAAVSVRWTLIGSVGSQILNFGFFTILARELGPLTFGLIALASIWVRFLTYFVNQGLGMAIVQRKDITNEHLNSVFWMSLGMAAVLAAGTSVFAGNIAGYFTEPNLKPVLIYLSISFILTAMSGVQTALLTRQQEFKLLAKRGLISTTIGSAAAVALAFAGAGVWSLVAKQLLTSALGSALLWNSSKWRPQFKFSFHDLRELWGFSINVFLRNLVGFFYLEGDKIVVARVIDATQLGIYSIAKQLSRMVIDILRKPLESVALPKLAKLQSDGAAMARAISRGQGLMTAVLMPIFVLIASTAPDTVSILFGHKWASATEPLRYLTLAEAVNTLAALSFTVLLAVNRPGLSLIHLIATAAGSIVATLIGSRWGVMGVAIGMLINSFLSTALNILILCRVTQLTYSQYLKTALSPILASITLAAAAVGVSLLLGPASNLYLRAICSGVAGVLAYVGTFRLIGGELYADGYRLLLATVGLKKSATALPSASL